MTATLFKFFDKTPEGKIILQPGNANYSPIIPENELRNFWESRWNSKKDVEKGISRIMKEVKSVPRWRAVGKKYSKFEVEISLCWIQTWQRFDAN